MVKLNTPEEAMSFVTALIDGTKQLAPNEKIDLSDKFTLRVRIPDPLEKSAISASYMEAFLEIQKQIYQLYALQKSGQANANFLSDDDKRKLEIAVVVSEGSSVYDFIPKEVVERLLEIADKMSGTQITIAIIAIAAIWGSAWAFKAYLSTNKDIKTEELKSADHRAALETIKAVSSEETDKFNAFKEAVKENSELGIKAMEVTEKSFDALVKATSKTEGGAEINGVELSKDQAKSLRASSRTQQETEDLPLKVRVIDVNTRESQHIIITIQDVNSGDEYKLSFADKLLEDKYRNEIFKALKTRLPIVVELRAKVHDGDIRKVELKKVLTE